MLVSPPDRSHPEFAAEALHLANVIEAFMHEIKTLSVRPPTRKEWALHKMWQLKVARKRLMEDSRSEPYFGRVDFTASDEQRKRSYYIGRVGTDHTTDWRAPVASLFYEGAEGEASYDAPGGIVKGLLHLRRHYRIQESELISVFDSLIEDSVRRGLIAGKPGWTDEYLIRELERSSGEQLKDIVATIQAEQHHAIRAPYDRAVVVQGVAGSGKKDHRCVTPDSLSHLRLS